MSHLLAPQEEKKDTRASQSEPAVSNTSFLVPPQEEKADVAALRGEQARIDQGMYYAEYLQQLASSRRVGLYASDTLHLQPSDVRRNR